MTDPLKVNQSDRDARARDILAATIEHYAMMISDQLRADDIRAGNSSPVYFNEALEAMLAFAQAEVGRVFPEGYAAGIEDAAQLADKWAAENRAAANKARGHAAYYALDGVATECNAIAHEIRKLTPEAQS